VKKVFITLATVSLLYGLMREFTFSKVLLMVGGLAAIYAVYRIPVRAIEAMKYPLIVLNLLVTALFFVYPKIYLAYPFRVAIVFVVFYAIMFYLVSSEADQKEFFKDLTALSILFFSSCFNLYMTGEILLVISFSLALMLALFIQDRTAAIPFIAGYTFIAIIFTYKQGAHLFGSGLTGLAPVEKYVLLLSSFAFLVTSFAMSMKQSALTRTLSFFGFLYIATDIFMVLGARMSNGLLYQPAIFLVLVSPLIGFILKSEGGRA